MSKKVLRVSEWLINLGSLALLAYIAVVLVRPHRTAYTGFQSTNRFSPGRGGSDYRNRLE